jgi:hypothetical protein
VARCSCVDFLRLFLSAYRFSHTNTEHHSIRRFAPALFPLTDFNNKSPPRVLVIGNLKLIANFQTSTALGGTFKPFRDRDLVSLLSSVNVHPLCLVELQKVHVVNVQNDRLVSRSLVVINKRGQCD